MVEKSIFAAEILEELDSASVIREGKLLVQQLLTGTVW